MTKEELRQEFNRPNFKQALKEYHGTRCVNCGSDEGVQFHHIIPLALGGTNCITNIVPLCHVCHKLVHGADKLAITFKPENTGRKRKQLRNLEEAVRRFRECEVGTAGFKSITGIAKGTHLSDCSTLSEYLESIGIKNIKNNVDLLNSPKHKNSEKNYFATVTYLDGRVEYIPRKGQA